MVLDSQPQGKIQLISGAVAQTFDSDVFSIVSGCD
jgi:hypothetical protein